MSIDVDVSGSAVAVDVASSSLAVDVESVRVDVTISDSNTVAVEIGAQTALSISVANVLIVAASGGIYFPTGW